MVRPFTPTLLGLIQRQGPPSLGPIMKGGPCVIPWVHGQIGNAISRPDALWLLAIKVVACNSPLPSPARLGVFLLTARGKEGLGPPLGQA